VGTGGITGSVSYNSLSDFTISGKFSISNIEADSFGFLLRLDDSGLHGYSANIQFISMGAIRFTLEEDASVQQVGTTIFTQFISVPSFSYVADIFYPFSVTAVGNTFIFDFLDGGASTSFIDTSLTSTSGQVGIVLTAEGYKFHLPFQTWNHYNRDTHRVRRFLHTADSRAIVFCSNITHSLGFHLLLLFYTRKDRLILPNY
jgi:hypothetical protein